MKNIFIIGAVLLFLGLILALFFHSAIWYSPFVVGGFLLFESLNTRYGFSILSSKRKFLVVWLIFILLGILIELITNTWLDLFDYPYYGKSLYLINVTIIGYPFVGFFGLEFFIWLHNRFKKKTMMLFPAAFIFGYVNELPNLLAYEWRYKNWPLGELLGIPILVSIFWIGLLLTLLFKGKLSGKNQGRI